jgi:signal transduction histidine kinase
LRIPRGVNPSHRSQPGEFAARDAGHALALAAAAETLRGMGVRPAPRPSAEDARIVRSLDALLAQATRAARHSSGAVRAYASLISDGYGVDSNAGRWAAKIERSASDLDEFVARTGALRLCETERPSDVRWGDVLARVAARCGALGACTMEVVDRTRAPFRQRAELSGRALFHMVRNAVEATPRPGLVRVRADEIRLAGRRAIHVRVTDHGPGLGRDGDVDAIWKPFVSHKPGHAGLGLAYVATCAAALGAASGVRSDGAGTTFHTIILEQGELSW